MSSSESFLALVEDLDDNIEDLEECLEPFLASTLALATKKLPVLDKAKLYVLVVYAIESLLFCRPDCSHSTLEARWGYHCPPRSILTDLFTAYLRLNGVQAKDHAVFKELTRVKQYFEKIKVAEDGPAKPRENMSLNKDAAGRFISHALVRGNPGVILPLRGKEALATRRLLTICVTVVARLGR